MDYEERLKAAAHLILSNDRHRLEQDPPLDCSGLGVSAVLKPHQIDGVSWLIRRYVLGVNVVLGTVEIPLRSLFVCTSYLLPYIYTSFGLVAGDEVWFFYSVI